MNIKNYFILIFKVYEGEVRFYATKEIGSIFSRAKLDFMQRKISAQSVERDVSDRIATQLAQHIKHKKGRVSSALYPVCY